MRVEKAPGTIKMHIITMHLFRSHFLLVIANACERVYMSAREHERHIAFHIGRRRQRQVFAGWGLYMAMR